MNVFDDAYVWTMAFLSQKPMTSYEVCRLVVKQRGVSMQTCYRTIGHLIEGEYIAEVGNRKARNHQMIKILDLTFKGRVALTNGLMLRQAELKRLESVANVLWKDEVA